MKATGSITQWKQLNDSYSYQNFDADTNWPLLYTGLPRGGRWRRIWGYHAMSAVSPKGTRWRSYRGVAKLCTYIKQLCKKRPSRTPSYFTWCVMDQAAQDSNSITKYSSMSNPGSRSPDASKRTAPRTCEVPYRRASEAVPLHGIESPLLHNYRFQLNYLEQIFISSCILFLISHHISNESYLIFDFISSFKPMRRRCGASLRVTRMHIQVHGANHSSIYSVMVPTYNPCQTSTPWPCSSLYACVFISLQRLWMVWWNQYFIPECIYWCWEGAT